MSGASLRQGVSIQEVAVVDRWRGEIRSAQFDHRNIQGASWGAVWRGDTEAPCFGSQ